MCLYCLVDAILLGTLVAAGSYMAQHGIQTGISVLLQLDTVCVDRLVASSFSVCTWCAASLGQSVAQWPGRGVSEVQWNLS